MSMYLFPFFQFLLFFKRCQSYMEPQNLTNDSERYLDIMNTRLRGLLVLVSLFISLLVSQMHSLMLLKLTYFKHVGNSQFFCDPSQLFDHVCSDTFTNNTVMYFGAVSGFLLITGIFFSYYKIVSSILMVPSSRGRYKSFSTYGSHLTIVCLFYGTGLHVYLSSAISQSCRKDTAVSVMYTVVTPMLNTFIYNVKKTEMSKGSCGGSSAKQSVSKICFVLGFFSGWDMQY